MPRPKIPKTVAARVFARSEGKCWHCRADLVLGARTPGMQGAWNVDHYPVPYRDIEDQMCWGVTDPLLESNLVAACVACNQSHEFERPGVWCGSTQMPCRRAAWRRVGAVVAGAALVLLGWVAGTLAPAW